MPALENCTFVAEPVSSASPALHYNEGGKVLELGNSFFLDMAETIWLASLDKQAEGILNEKDAADFPLLWFGLF